MPLNDLLHHVHDEGQKQAEEILHQARRRAESIRRDAEARAMARLASALEAERSLREREAARLLTGARKQARRRLLIARHDLLDKAFASAAERLPRAETCLSTEARLRRRAAAAECLPPDRGAVLHEQPAAELTTEDGSIRVDLSLASLLSALRPELEGAVLERAKGGG